MNKLPVRRPHADNLPRHIGSILRDESITEPIALVLGLIIAMSTTLIFAREKVGKTTFLSFLMKSLALGLPIFGRRSKPQTVLFASLEEGVHLIKMRAKHMSVPQKAPVHILRSVRHPTKTPLKVLEEAIVATKATVVVLDTLSAYSVGQAKENSPEAWNEALYPLTQLTSTHGFALVIVHHANKGGTENFRGPTSIGAAVGTIASLSIPKNAPSNVRRIRYNGRYGAGDLYVARNADTGDYDLVESESIPAETVRGSVNDDLLEKRILDARTVEGGATKETLRKAGGVKAVRSDAVIEELLVDGRLVKKKVAGGYRYLAA